MQQQNFFTPRGLPVSRLPSGLHCLRLQATLLQQHPYKLASTPDDMLRALVRAADAALQRQAPFTLNINAAAPSLLDPCSEVSVA